MAMLMPLRFSVFYHVPRHSRLTVCSRGRLCSTVLACFMEQRFGLIAGADELPGATGRRQEGGHLRGQLMMANPAQRAVGARD